MMVTAGTVWGDSLVRISMSGNVMKPDKKVIKMDT